MSHFSIKAAAVSFVYFSLFLFTLIDSTKAANNNLPEIGSSASQALSLAKEQAIGDSYMRQLRSLAPLMNDPEVNDYIQHLGFKLVENNLRASDRPFLFFVIQDNTINAFALPGGYIGIHTGLITKSENESELASVIAHEIAHVTQRHLARRIELQSQMAIPSLAAFVAAILIASQSRNSDAAIATMVGSQGLAQQSIINHTRSNESEADRIGITTMFRSGFDPDAVASFFEKMQANSRYQSNSFEFLRTHPLSRNRITDARLRASEFPNRPVIEKPTYSLIKEKIIALTARITPTLLQSASSRYKDGQLDTDAKIYGYAVLLSRAKKFKQAERLLQILIEKAPSQTSYAIAMAELNIIKGTPKRSLPIIQEFLDKIPGNLALIEMNTKLLLANNQAEKARELILENIHMTLQAPYLLKLLSKAQEQSGHNSEVFETEGNYLLSIGDLIGARNQYYQALNTQTEDPYARQRINSQLARIKEFLYKRSLRH
ncbi:MAG: peptidase M48 Ste24p [Kangiella sp.]|nr:MAG: peptidase M48 Ste24p [Kangiella sp.]